MSKLSKLLMVVFLLSGCIQKPIIKEDPKDEVVIFQKPKGEVLTPDQKTEDVVNKIVIDTVTKEIYNEHGNSWYNYPVISGMSDPVAQTKVNQDIYNSVMSYKTFMTRAGIPKYQGIFTNKLAGPANNYFVQSSVTYNFNNVLSIMVEMTFHFQTKIGLITGGSLQTMKLLGLNYDLTTGERVTIADLFINGYDYENYINYNIYLNSQYHYYNSIKEVPYGDPGDWDNLSAWTYSRYIVQYGFKGITPTQQFYIHDRLEMIFDESTPAFYNEYSPFTISISLPSDGMAIRQRFMKQP